MGADLSARVQLFDPDEPLRHQIYAKLSGRLILNEHFNLFTSYALDISNDFTQARGSDSVLPRVRSNSDLYLTEGDSGLNSLYVESRYSPNSSIHNRAYFGILEEMFSGLGTEFLS